MLIVHGKITFFVFSLQNPEFKDWCSELLVWRVDSVGPLGRSGGVTELARLNSPKPKAFSDAAWIPTLLPSYSLGTVCNSPSACFVASDGVRLRVYQAVLDGRALLAELSMSDRRTRRIIDESTMSLSTDSSLRDNVGQTNLSEVFNIVSEQSTARPGCVVQLATIDDAEHHSHTTQLLHVYQEGLVHGIDADVHNVAGAGSNPASDAHEDPVAQSTRPMIEEPFYVTRLEETPTGSVVHMWRLVMVTHQHSHDLLDSPDDVDQDDVFGAAHPHEPHSKEHQHHHQQQHQKQQDASPVLSKTVKVCCQRLPLPPGVSVVHAAPSAGHLSSACIYPACRSPYLMATACTDNTIRFWRCSVTGTGEGVSVEWLEWNMVSKSQESAITLPGVPLHVSCAYSGRIACAYLPPEVAAVVTPWPDSSASKFTCKVAVYECESTGGSQWIMCEPVTVEDVVTTDAWQLGEQLLDLAHVTKVHQSRGKKTSQGTAHENMIQSSATNSQSSFSNSRDKMSSDTVRTLQSSLFVPSKSTLYSIKSQKFSKRGTHVKQRNPVQIDWVSKEDGSFLLTVAIGSKIVVFCDVNEDLATIVASNEDRRSNLIGTSTAAVASSRAPVLKKSFSMNQIAPSKSQKYLELSRVQLRTADNLAPLPMSIGWVREGVLVVGMDNEMHCYTQWTECSLHSDDTNSELLNVLQLKPAVRNLHPSCKILYDEKNKGSTDLQFIIPEPFSVGLMEASQTASPVLPLYHPRQLYELLNSGKIRRVKAILAHLLKYLISLSHRTDGGALFDEPRSRLWSRSRTLSVNAPYSSTGGGRCDTRGSLSLQPEDVTLVDVKTVPPMPLWMLLQADREATLPQQPESKEEAYAELFGGFMPYGDDELNLDEDETDRHQRRASMSYERSCLTYFGPRQTQFLASLLTHTQLPGLSSLDQMHLLALADTVASCNLDFADKFDINKDKEAIAKESYSRSATDEPSMGG